MSAADAELILVATVTHRSAKIYRNPNLMTTQPTDAETLRALQFALAPLPESERQILRCAPPFDAQSEHEADLRYESRVDYESWEADPQEAE